MKVKFVCSVKERQKQGHKDSTSDIYWDSWDTGKTREKITSLSISPSKRSSCSSVTLDSDAPLSSPSSDAGTEGSRLSTLSTSDTDGGLSPKLSPQPPYFMKRSVSDDANLGIVKRTTIIFGNKISSINCCSMIVDNEGSPRYSVLDSGEYQALQIEFGELS